MHSGMGTQEQGRWERMAELFELSVTFQHAEESVPSRGRPRKGRRG